MKQALSISNVLNAKFRTINVSDEWRRVVGIPELTGTWMIYGAPKNGKTTFAMQLAKYLCGFGRVAYDSVEEGLSLTIQSTMERVRMDEVNGQCMLLDREPVADLIKRLHKQRAADFVFLDSVQFADLKFCEYKALKKAFPHKLFIYISHINGGTPDGQVAKRIWRDCNVYFKVEGYRAFPVSRYGGGEPWTVWKEGAEKVWGQLTMDNGQLTMDN